MTCVRSYRESMAEFSQMKTLELWYYALSADEILARADNPKFRQRVVKRIEKEQAKSAAEEIFPSLWNTKGICPSSRTSSPLSSTPRTFRPGRSSNPSWTQSQIYRGTLPHALQSLFDRYEVRDAAHKVVGVGSVGTSCWVLLFMAGADDPLFLQVKEARASVFEAYTSPSVFPNHGQRVVNGYRLMQPASDMFLGWSRRSTAEARLLRPPA